MIAPCGLDCAKCEAYLATQDNDMEKLKAIAKKWSDEFKVPVQAEHIICDGCNGRGRLAYNAQELCKIRKCTQVKSIENCGKCEDSYCELLTPIFEHEPQAKQRLENLKS